MDKENILREKSFLFSLEVIQSWKLIRVNKVPYDLASQFVRSGTAIGALIRESEHAESKKDFIHKLSISLKEAMECEYWIDLLNKSGYLPEEITRVLQIQLLALIKMLTASIRTVKSRL